MKKGKAIFTILLVFVLGFLTGSIGVILTRQNGVEKFWVHHMAQSPVTKEPISIELMVNGYQSEKDFILTASYHRFI
jgi:hypothetical protein